MLAYEKNVKGVTFKIWLVIFELLLYGIEITSANVSSS